VSPGAHLLISWLSVVPTLKNRRERALVALAGVAPDIDGLGIIIDKLSSHKTDLYFQYHHYIGHNIFFALVISALAFALARTQKLWVSFMGLLAVHLHLLCDILGSRGPDGYQWPVFYFYPLNNEIELIWSGQWELNAWQNQVIMVMLFALSYVVLVRKGITFLEVISPRLEKEAFVMWGKYVNKNT
jgi:inner membrane protein